MPSYDVFISYNKNDFKAAEIVAGRLRDEAFLEPFLDEWNLIPGDPRQEGIEAALNHWLKALAGQYERRDLARTYVAVRPGHSEVLGYCAISNHRVSHEAVPA